VEELVVVMIDRIEESSQPTPGAEAAPAAEANAPAAAPPAEPEKVKKPHRRKARNRVLFDSRVGAALRLQ
jgi:hypothetical protein